MHLSLRAGTFSDAWTDEETPSSRRSLRGPLLGMAARSVGIWLGLLAAIALLAGRDGALALLASF